MARAFHRCWQLVLLLACASHVSGNDEKNPSKSPATNSFIAELKGRVIPGPGESRSFKTDAGPSYLLVSNGMSTALFVDTNLQSKLLLLKGRVQNGQRFEVTGNYRSIRGGKVLELYYYCDICAIKSSDPGPCMCCRDPVHLVEEARESH